MNQKYQELLQKWKTKVVRKNKNPRSLGNDQKSGKIFKAKVVCYYFSQKLLVKVTIIISN